MSSLMWWNSWSSLHTYLVYGHTSKSSVKAVHVKLPHKMVRADKPRVNLSRLPHTSLLWSHTSSMWTMLRACTRSNRGGWRLVNLGVLKSLWSCWPVLSTSLADLLDAGDREGDDQVDHEEYDDNIMSFDESDEWWVLTVLLQVQHTLAYILA